MIKDLIVRLMEEANEEAEHKGWCDTELSTNEQTRKEKTEAVETLHAEIDQLEASIAKLTEDIADLTKAVAELDAAMAKATKLRTEEKAKKHRNNCRLAGGPDRSCSGAHSFERVLCESGRSYCIVAETRDLRFTIQRHAI
jgi:septal ring factor EnvC (AmiA/AmiB activator)